MEDLLAQRGVAVSYEAIRLWCNKFGPEYARGLKRREGRLGDTWHLDEVFVTIQGQRQYLWRAVDQDGDVIDILVQPVRSKYSCGFPMVETEQPLRVKILKRQPGSRCFRHQVLLRRQRHLNAHGSCLRTSATERDHVVRY